VPLYARSDRERLRAVAIETTTQGEKTMQVHVLLADDSLDLRSFIGIGLERAGYRVSLAANGDQAVDMLIDLIPDVAVLDVNMPGQDGLSVCRVARSHPKLTHLRIVVISGNPVEREAMDAGADEFIAKPFLSRHLNAAVERLLQAPQRHSGESFRLQTT